jgi:hypothetical protein
MPPRLFDGLLHLFVKIKRSSPRIIGDRKRTEGGAVPQGTYV